MRSQRNFLPSPSSSSSSSSPSSSQPSPLSSGMESTDSSGGPQLPPGFRFHPTDEELVVHYLKKKAASAPLPVAIIAEVDLYKFDPWELPAKATFGEQEWYFFSPRDRKYPNGARPNRAATSGYWKATGTDKPVLTSGGTQKVGVKKALVFYGGKPPKGVKTNWIMHEYRLSDSKASSSPSKPPPGFDAKKASLRLDDWVLCRIYKKNSTQRCIDQVEGSMEEITGGGSTPVQKMSAQSVSEYSVMMEHEANLIMEGSLGSTAVTPAKRGLPVGYWGDSGVKRFLPDSGEGLGGSMVTLLGHMQQTPPPLMQQQAMLGSLEHGVFQQYQVAGMMDWYS